MCNYDGACSTWEADGGANHAFIFLMSHLELAEPPASKVQILRGATHGVRIIEHEGGYDQAHAAWVKAQGVRGRMVLGQWLGEPSWIQADETPVCHCGKKMTRKLRDVAHLLTIDEHNLRNESI